MHRFRLHPLIQFFEPVRSSTQPSPKGEKRKQGRPGGASGPGGVVVVDGAEEALPEGVLLLVRRHRRQRRRRQQHVWDGGKGAARGCADGGRRGSGGGSLGWGQRPKVPMPVQNVCIFSKRIVKFGLGILMKRLKPFRTHKETCVLDWRRNGEAHGGFRFPVGTGDTFDGGRRGSRRRLKSAKDGATQFLPQSALLVWKEVIISFWGRSSLRGQLHQAKLQSSRGSAT